MKEAQTLSNVSVSRVVSTLNGVPTMNATYPIAATDLAAGPCRKSGEGEIRTLDTLAGIPVFETGAFGHSATSPGGRENVLTAASRVERSGDKEFL